MRSLRVLTSPTARRGGRGAPFRAAFHFVPWGKRLNYPRSDRHLRQFAFWLAFNAYLKVANLLKHLEDGVRALLRGISVAIVFAGFSIASSDASSERLTDPDSLPRQLEAQFQATLIAERRLADDREERLIREYEEKLQVARSAAAGGDDAALAELLTLRKAYADLVQKIVLTDLTAKAETERYRLEVQGIIGRASPERLAALQQFADGDRVGAWEVLDGLREAEDRAIEAAANSRRSKAYEEDAELREQMLERGEAKTTDVLPLWQRAADLDPQNFYAQSRTGDYLAELGQHSDAKVYYERGLQAAPDDRYRVWALVDLAVWASGSSDLEAAAEYLRQAYSTLQPLIAPGAPDDPFVSWVAYFLMSAMANAPPLDIDTQTNMRFRIFLSRLVKLDISASRAGQLMLMLPPAQITEAQLDTLEVMVGGLLDKRLSEASKYNDVGYDSAAIFAANTYSNLMILRGDFDEAERVSKAALVFADGALPQPLDLNDLYVTTSALVADANLAQGKFDESADRYRQILASVRKMSELDPPSVYKRRSVAVILQRLGAVELLRKNRAAALVAWNEARDVSLAMLQGDLGDHFLQYDLTITNMLISLAEPG